MQIVGLTATDNSCTGEKLTSSERNSLKPAGETPECAESSDWIPQSCNELL